MLKIKIDLTSVSFPQKCFQSSSQKCQHVQKLATIVTRNLHKLVGKTYGFDIKNSCAVYLLSVNIFRALALLQIFYLTRIFRARLDL